MGIVQEWLKGYKVTSTRVPAGLDTKGKYRPSMPGPVIASAVLASRTSGLAKMLKGTDWSGLAWQYYDTVPELRYGATWISNALSRARLYVGMPDGDGQSEPVPVETPLILDILNQLGGGFSGQAELLRRVAIHLTIPGETYIIGVDTAFGRKWLAVSADELTMRGTDIFVTLTPGDAPTLLEPTTSLIIRVWRPHARDGLKPDSPTRALLPVLKELVELSAHVAATIESRLAGAGVFIVPESATSTNPGGGEGDPLVDDPFVADLIDAMVTPTQDRDSAASIVPMVIKVPDGSVDNFKHITFATEFDERVEALREAAQKRVAIGMDMPFEILLGLGDSNHWSAWQIEESAVKIHIEPLLGLICDALTEQYLRPALAAAGVAGADELVIWYDTSELVLRPNQGPEARELYDKGLLSGDATRRASGFSDEDAPSDEETIRRLVINTITQNPELAPQLLPQISSGDRAALPQIAGPTSGPSAPTQTSEPSNRTEIPQTASAAVQVHDEGLLPWQLAVAEMAALRALERAGRFLMRGAGRQYRGKLMHIPDWELHTLLRAGEEQHDEILSGAYSLLQQAAHEWPCLTGTVDIYVRGLMSRQEKHSRAKLAASLATAGCIGGGRG